MSLHCLAAVDHVRGLRLTAGTHRVEYRYRSRPFALGLALAALASGVIAVVIGVGWRARCAISPTSP